MRRQEEEKHFRKCQTPPDGVVKCQALDIVGVISRLV
jgi:hypothetical protein